MTVPIFAFSTKQHMKLLEQANEKNRLISYFYLKQNFRSKDIREPAEKVQYERGLQDYFVLDSGAFSAWRKGITIDIFEYIDVIHEVSDLFTHFVCLDVINDPIASEAHHRIMLEEGCANVIPVFHSGESISVLDYLTRYDYIGISPNNDWIEAQKVRWLDQVFSRDLGSTKTHGFGYMGLTGIGRVPLTTGDSAQWIFNGACGGINTPYGQVRISERMKHSTLYLWRLAPDIQEHVVSWVSNLGFDMDKLVKDTCEREIFNVVALRNIIAAASESRKADLNNDAQSALIEDNGTGFGFTKAFTEEAIIDEIKRVRSGERKEGPSAARASTRNKKVSVEVPERFF